MRHNTPRHPRPNRGIGTLIGNGWLRESARNAWSGPKWDLHRGRSALRKCMFMPVPDEVKALAPSVSPAMPMPRVAKPKPVEEVVHRRDPRKDVREFPAYVPGAVLDPRAVAQQAHAALVRDAQKAANKAVAAWWEDPVAFGSLLILLPPIGLAAVWSSKRYSSDARWALTVMTALTMCLMSAILIAALAMH